MNITDDIKYIGVNDRRPGLFEAQYRTPHGMSYNSYVIPDEHTAVMDTVEKSFTHTWLDNLAAALEGREPEYLVIHHMEPDHSANIANFMKAYPRARIVSSAKAFAMMKNFFGTEYEDRRVVVSDGDTLSLGRHTLTFFTAPMVHWPEVIVSYDSTDRVLFSADSFGKFGAIDTEEDWADEARRYYIGIVGKYGTQVQALLKKVSGLKLDIICPLHGPVLTEALSYYLGLYQTWSSYAPESEGVVIAYTSIYGNTRKAAEDLRDKLIQKGCPCVVLHDLTVCDMSQAVADAFRYSRLVLATTTYNAGIFPSMHTFITQLTERGFRNRTVGMIENGSWAPMAAKTMKAMLAESKGIELAEPVVRISSKPNGQNAEEAESLAAALCTDYSAANAAKQNPAAMFKIGYGLYAVTSNDGKKDNALIVNTVSQVTNSPNRIAVCINQDNYSHHIIKQTGKMNVCCLSTDAPFSVFERFGFCSGRSTDKFAGTSPKHTANGLALPEEYINAYMSLEVEQYVDLGTHGMFICRVTESGVISDRDTMTYTYYQSNVKPKPQTKGKKGYVCKICGYVYEGDTLPRDFVCPLCKHGASDFEPVENI